MGEAELRIRCLRLEERLRVLAQATTAFAQATFDSRCLGEAVVRLVAEVLKVTATCSVPQRMAARSSPKRSGAIFCRDETLLSVTRQMLTGDRQLGEGIAGAAAAQGRPILVPVIDQKNFHEGSYPECRALLERYEVTPITSSRETNGIAITLSARPNNCFKPASVSCVKRVFTQRRHARTRDAGQRQNR